MGGGWARWGGEEWVVGWGVRLVSVGRRKNSVVVTEFGGA